MSNTSKGAAEHNYGSKYWIQTIVNDPELCKQLSRAISGQSNLWWISPVYREDYAEFKLNQQIMLDTIGILDKEVANEVFSFWPTQQPQWDGIAISKDNKDIYLIEAKAHVEEVRTKMTRPKSNASEKARENEKLILASMQEAFEHLSDGGNFECWKDKYYQLGNRLTFMYFLNKSSMMRGIQFHIVLLNFVNDGHFQNTFEMWDNDYRIIWKEMLGNADVPETVKVINWDVMA